MANSEHLKILQEGSGVWNRWREQQPAILEIDLNGVDLTGANLREANLSRADLLHAKLNGADLSYAYLNWTDLSYTDLNYTYLNGARLNWADLSHTNLKHANLSYANLNKANLRKANLSGADLSKADLSGANLSEADLCEANLSKARLFGANLSEANLNKANLSEANLVLADLSRADLSGADLSGANLSEANLNEADLSMLKLEKTNWTNAVAGFTIFAALDLRFVIGLETVRHTFRSSIGLDTIYESRGQIPEAFLRGAGVPETFITNMRALVDSMSPIDYYTCFIAYSHHNEDFAKRLHADLQAKGVRCWFAPEDLKIGDHYHRRIDEAIRIYDKLIIVFSETSIESTWVEREVVAAREKEERQSREVLFPLRLDEAVLHTEQHWAADVRRRWHIGDFTCWKDHDTYQLAFDRLLRDLQAT